MKAMRHLALAFLAAACTGCIVYPKQVSRYDTDCGATTQRLELDAVLLFDCEAGGDQEACLIAVVGVGAATAVVSSSIVIAGNVAYWLQERDRCKHARG